MNIENVRRVRDAIADEENPIGFDMTEWCGLPLGSGRCWPGDMPRGDARCGTAGCIAGHAAALTGSERIPHREIRERARIFLDLSPAQADYLFLARWTDTALSDVTREDVVVYLDLCVEAGALVDYYTGV